MRRRRTFGHCRRSTRRPFFVSFSFVSAQIMWFLGAGASRSAGIKTAGDMIWDFKQRLYRSQKKLPPSAITDIGEPAVQRKLQAHFDGLGGFPPAGSETEYSAYFEATYHAPRDRRAYLDELIARGKPSFGHHALALLMLVGSLPNRLDHQFRSHHRGCSRRTPRRDGTAGRR